MEKPQVLLSRGRFSEELNEKVIDCIEISLKGFRLERDRERLLNAFVQFKKDMLVLYLYDVLTKSEFSYCIDYATTIYLDRAKSIINSDRGV